MGARFSEPSRPAVGLTVPSGGKAAGSWRRPTPSSAEFKERVELLVYSSRVNLTFYVHVLTFKIVSRIDLEMAIY